jgi:AmmeMemoRadiSam system protein B
VKADQPLLAKIKERFPVAFEEDLCHQAEHAIEFQLPFLQQVVGSKKPFTIVPILCSFSALGMAEAPIQQSVEVFLAGLRDILKTSGRSYCVVAAAELAHLGMRYGDKEPPTDFSFHRSMQHYL